MGKLPKKFLFFLGILINILRMWLEGCLSLVIFYFLGTLISESIKARFWRKRHPEREFDTDKVKTIKEKIIEKIDYLRNLIGQFISKIRGTGG